MLKEMLLVTVTSAGLHIGSAKHVTVYAPTEKGVEVFNAKTEKPFVKIEGGAWNIVIERVATLGKFPPSEDVQRTQAATYRMPFENVWPSYACTFIPLKLPSDALPVPVTGAGPDATGLFPVDPTIEHVYDVWGYYTIDTAKYGSAFTSRSTAMSVLYPEDGEIFVVDVVIARADNDPAVMMTRDGKMLARPTFALKWAGPCDLNTDGRIDAEDTLTFSTTLPDWNDDGMHDEGDWTDFQEAFLKAQERMPVLSSTTNSLPSPSPPLVNVNEATLTELATLPGIGPALAQRIIAGRPYGSIDDLVRVAGIGPPTLNRFRDRVRTK